MIDPKFQALKQKLKSGTTKKSIIAHLCDPIWHCCDIENAEAISYLGEGYFGRAVPHFLRLCARFARAAQFAVVMGQAEEAEIAQK